MKAATLLGPGVPPKTLHDPVSPILVKAEFSRALDHFSRGVFLYVISQAYIRFLAV
jgi:hypothetical protein